ncbi:iron chaperone [Streptomyces sp. NPDC020917]|uniref:iron chaperone n=1 Tax=Streptomyces sp. NPDC020917 TaxID=3365102 RepID=UPI0037B6D51A
MDAEVRDYIDAIAAEHRPLFDRVHRLILQAYPEAGPTLSYGMPTYRVGDRKVHVGVWQHGVSIYGWDRERGAGFTARHPDFLSGKATIRLPSRKAADVTDAELSDLLRGSLDA